MRRPRAPGAPSPYTPLHARRYDALKECHTELLWSRAVVDAEGLGADLAPGAPVAEADGVVGGTALGRELGRGASSVVFEGRTADGAPCAVKRIAKASAKTLREVRTIGAECEALRALSAGGATPALVATMSTPRFLYVVTDLFGEELYGHVRARGLLGPRPRLQVFAGAAKRATRATSKAPLSAGFRSFRLIFGRAIISRNGLEAWMLFPERARAEHSR